MYKGKINTKLLKCNIFNARDFRIRAG